MKIVKYIDLNLDLLVFVIPPVIRTIVVQRYCRDVYI